MLTDEDIEKCREKATASYKRHYYSTRGQQVTAADDTEMHLIWEVIAACEAKLREQNEPVGYHFRDDPSCFAMPGSGYSHEYPTEALDIVPLYKHPAPIPEGLLDLLAIIHRDGGHYTDEHGIDKAINDAKDKVWAMLAAARSGE